MQLVTVLAVEIFLEYQLAVSRDQDSLDLGRVHGLDRHVHDHLRRVRRRSSADEEPEPRGLGLGLWIVRSIIERHGGTVAAGRSPEDRTRFTIVLPAGKDEP